MKTYWKADRYSAAIKEVSEANKKAQEKYECRWNFPASQYFDTKQEALTYKVDQLEGEIVAAEKKLANIRLRLKKFIKKHSPEKVG